MTTIAWVVHNNSANMARLIIEGMVDLGISAIDHISSREDLLYLRDPAIPPAGDVDQIGEFPDYKSFQASLATPRFWERMPEADFIVLTINRGPNHNAFRAADLVRQKNLYHKLIYLDEDETGLLNPKFSDMFLNSRFSFTWRPRLYQQFAVHPHVVNLGFNGVENRYRQFIPVSFSAKKADVFYRGRAGARMPHREPFIAALKARAYPNSHIMPKLASNTTQEEFRQQHVSGNRHNVSYYQLLAESKVSVYLNGYNPLGYQFWENAALLAAQVMQEAYPCKWYHGGSYPAKLIDFEEYDPPFKRGEHFLTFETPDQMIDRVDYLLRHDKEREEIALGCQRHALEHYSSRARAKRFLEYILSNGD